MVRQFPTARTGDPAYERVRNFFLTNPAVETLLPFTLENGAEIYDLAVHCAGCDSAIDGKRLRGKVEPAAGGAYLAELVGACTTCDLYTPSRIHIVPRGEQFVLEKLETTLCDRYEDNVVPFPCGGR